MNDIKKNLKFLWNHEFMKLVNNLLKLKKRLPIMSNNLLRLVNNLLRLPFHDLMNC